MSFDAHGPTERWVAGVLLAAVAWIAPVQVQEPGPVRTVEVVDLDRYVGDWFEVARLPNRFQRDCAGDVRARYMRRADGRIDVLNQCRRADGSLTEAQGVARVVDSRTSARLKVRFAPAVLSFLPMVWGDYWVLGLAGDYSWAVVGSPDRKYLWILARTPALEADRYEAAVAVARANGFATGEMLKTRQSGGSRGPVTRAAGPEPRGREATRQLNQTGGLGHIVRRPLTRPTRNSTIATTSKTWMNAPTV